MQYRLFGNTGIKVPVLGYGAGEIGDSSVSDGDASGLLNTVLDSGITFIDTARGYGLSEERIGKFLSPRRNEFILSTKVGYGIQGVEDWTYQSVRKGVEEALRIMRTEYIDIVHLHSCSSEILRKGDVIKALLECRQEGKLLLAAYSGENEELDYAVNSGFFDCVQTSVNICDQRSLINTLPVAREKGLGVIAKRPLANAPWRFRERPSGHYCLVYWDRLKQMGIDNGGIDWDELALRFTAFSGGVHTCIAGTTSKDHIKNNAEIITKGPLPVEIYNGVMEKFSIFGNDWRGEI